VRNDRARFNALDTGRWVHEVLRKKFSTLTALGNFSLEGLWAVHGKEVYHQMVDAQT